MIVGWIAFCGANWLWDDGTPNGELGDMAGPLASWTDAATWALTVFPLGDNPSAPLDDDDKKYVDQLIRPITSPQTWATPGTVPGQLILANREQDGLPPEAVQAALDAEKAVFWDSWQAKTGG